MKYREIVFGIEFVVLLGFVLPDDQHLIAGFDRVDQVIQHDDFPLARDAPGLDAVRGFLDVDFLEVAVLAHILQDSELPFVAVRAFA